MFYHQIDEKNAGRYRSVQVFISGSHHQLPTASQVPDLMNKFVTWFNANETKLNPVEFAALVHQKFVFIHPFVDGNGRLSRLLMNLALLRAGYTISIIPPILRSEYITNLEKAHSDTKPFIEFIKGQVIETQRELLRLFGESGGAKQAVGGVSGGVIPNIDRIFAAIHQFPGINAKGLARQLDIPLRTLQRHIKTLSVEHKIEFRGAAKNGGYFFIE